MYVYVNVILRSGVEYIGLLLENKPLRVCIRQGLFIEKFPREQVKNIRILKISIDNGAIL